MFSFDAPSKVLVVGATGGIGQDVVVQLNQLGVSVIAAGRNAAKLEKLKHSCVKPELVEIECIDFSGDLDSIPQWVIGLLAKYGRLTGMVCAAGVATTTPLLLLDASGLRSMIDVNYYLPVMLAKGFLSAGRGASIVFVASLAAEFCWKGQTSYAGSKAALIASCKVMARELAGRGIRVNCVSPGYIKTSMLDVVSQENLEQLKSRMPLGLGEPEDVSQCIVFLLSNSAKWITGQNFIVDCGLI